MNRFKTVFFYIFMSSILVFNTVKPAMFTELARRKVRSAYEWAKKKLLTQPELAVSPPIASPKISEPIAFPTIPHHYDASFFAQEAELAKKQFGEVKTKITPSIQEQQKKTDSDTSVAVDSPEENIIYVAGLEGSTAEHLVQIPLEIAKKMKTLNNMLGDLSEGTQKIFPHIIPLGNYSKDIIEKVVAILTDINNPEEKENENKLKLETTISKHVNQMPLNQQLLCLRFCHHMDITDILPTFIDKTLYRVSKASFNAMQKSTALDDLKSGDELGKDIVYDPLREILRLLIIQKYVNERKKVVDGHSYAINTVLCSNDASIIASQGIYQSMLSLYDTFCISNIHFHNMPSIKEWFVFAKDRTEIPIKILDISKDGTKVLFYSSQKSYAGLLPGLYLYYRNETDNKFEVKQLTKKIDYLSARFNQPGTHIITCNNPNQAVLQLWDIEKFFVQPIQLQDQTFLLPGLDFAQDVQDGNVIKFPHIDFVNDTTIALFCVDNSKKFKVLFYNILSQEKKSLDLFDCTQFEVILCDVNKDKSMIAIIKTNVHTEESNLYIIDNEQKVETIKISSKIANDSIRFSTDGSKIIASKLKQRVFKVIGDVSYAETISLERIYNIKNKKLLYNSTSFESEFDCYHNIISYLSKNKDTIILDIIEPNTCEGIAKYLYFKTQLSGLQGTITSLQFSKDGNNVIGSSNGKNNNLIVWPLVTKEEDDALKDLNKKVDISLAKLLLPISIASLKGETTAIPAQEWNKINKTLSSLPKSISDALLIKIQELQKSPISVPPSYLQKSSDWQKQKLLSQEPNISATE